MLKILKNYFYPVPYADIELQRKADYFLNYAFATIFLLLVNLIFCFITLNTVWLYTSLILLAAVVCVLFIFKWTRSFFWGGNIGAFAFHTGLIVASYYTGNLHSPGLIWLIISPSTIFLLVNKNSGIIWTVIADLAILMIAFLDFKGIVVPNRFPPEWRDFVLTTTYLLVSVFILAIVIIFEKSKNNALNQLVEKNSELQKAMHELRLTQAQLIQSEKMASLGRLTAGIAHEIKNPLNFVNNFSQLSHELLSKVEQTDDDEERAEMMSDLKNNLEKIVQHGKRADNIVTKMVEHSRPPAGQKQATDVNALCHKNIELALIGFKARHGDFECDLEEHLESGLKQVSVIPEELDRVMENMLNNAMYSLWEKRKNNPGFKVSVRIETKSAPGGIYICIKDNGTGIPDQLKEKIFEPFFTTKPTGQAAGLGLSLCYDIIKSYGGEIKFESGENNFAEFIVFLPG